MRPRYLCLLNAACWMAGTDQPAGATPRFRAAVRKGFDIPTSATAAGGLLSASPSTSTTSLLAHSRAAPSASAHLPSAPVQCMHSTHHHPHPRSTRSISPRGWCLVVVQGPVGAAAADQQQQQEVRRPAEPTPPHPSRSDTLPVASPRKWRPGCGPATGR